MAGTRSSARLAGNSNSSPPSAKSDGGNKRKAESSPASNKSKRGKKGAKDQKTLEETMPDAEAQVDEAEKDQPEDIEMKEAANGGEGENAEPANQSKDPKPSKGAKTGSNDHAGEDKNYDRGDGCWFWLDNATYASKDESDSAKPVDESKTFQPGDSFKGKNKEGESKDDPEKSLKDSRGGAGLNALTDGKAEEPKDAPTDDTHAAESTAPAVAHQKGDAKQEGSKKDNGEATAESKDGGAVEESKERADAQPSNIMEKGVIYFFTRGRVSVDEPESVQDLQRSYFVLRPLPEGAKLGDGSIKDLKNNRLMALPKKVWPKSGKDRFMVFVESAGVTLAELKENFFSGSEYSTQTTGTRQQHPVTPLGEGVYAITSTGNGSESHLAYMLTIPQEPGQMQEDVGIRSKGSFVLSLKNPTVKGPANASLPQSPDYPQEFIDEFRSRGWMPAQPKHLDYANAQVLLIGEDMENGHALEATSKDEKSDDKETPQEEIEKLEHEDEIRVSHLKGDDTVFADLGISSKDYPSVSTTW